MCLIFVIGFHYISETLKLSVMVAFLDPGVAELLVQTDFFTAQSFSYL